MAKYFIGTAGWSYKDWVPSFFPKNQTGGFDWLQFYAHYFNCVEVNASYYTYLNPKIVEGWVNKLSGVDDFLFTVKLHQDFTHKRDFNKQKVNAVNFNLNILAGAERLGGLLIQFPYSFQFNDVSADLLRRLKENFEMYDLFVEVRHISWNKEEALKLFKEQNLTLCTIDQPQIGKSISFEPVFTNDIMYIRLHGRNIEEWKNSINNFGKTLTPEEQNARYDYLYSPGELIEIQQKVQEKLKNIKTVYVILNNHPKGNAVANAFELIYFLTGNTKVNIPANTVKCFPRLEKISEDRLWLV